MGEMKVQRWFGDVNEKHHVMFRELHGFNHANKTAYRADIMSML